MYDLCLKRLTRKARAAAAAAAGRPQDRGSSQDRSSSSTDPHSLIQRVLLSGAAMPALQYFISTYDPVELRLSPGEDGGSGDDDGGGDGDGGGDDRSSRGNTWRLVHQKKLPCSTDSYMFYVYQRVPATGT
jgi:hypothetical protein